MAHFYATIKGSHGEASRLGTKNSGIHARVNGWDCGVEIIAEYNESTNEDVFTIWRTSGSNSRHTRQLIDVIKSLPE